LIAIPEGFEAGAIAERARKLCPAIPITARAHSDAEVTHLERIGVNEVVLGEREIADTMLRLCVGRLVPRVG
jgi:CPA2 family monovalent cation:H+ antiporter-2